MKPRRLVLSRRFLRLHALHTSVICTLATTIVVNAGDILRGGSAGAVTPGTSSGLNTPPPVTPNAGHGNDSLARTTQAIQAVQAMQAAARNLATSGANNLGQNPNNPSQVLPDVPDGLTIGGLKVDSRVPTTPSLWTGANAPTQTTNTGSGRVEVTVKQTAQQAILNWDTFNVGKNTDLKFDQSAGGSNVGQWTAFNKVNDTSANPTQILGTITAPGQVYIINRNGILFGGSSKVNTHTLVASSLPINDNLIERGLLNNPDQQFLFSAMALTAGANGTPAFDPGVSPSTKIGDVIVQKGAQLSAPTTADKVGGRIALVGPNVVNDGTITTPDGQTILAAGLQVGFEAHSSSDPSLRGLDVHIGAVADPLSTVAPYAGSAINSGLIDSPRANITLAGKALQQLGVISSTTSVALNGRIDLLANYDAVGNIAYNATNANFGPRFLNQSTGTILLGEGSVTAVLPELSSKDKVVGSQLALSSQVNVVGKFVHFDNSSLLVAPSADVTINAGVWNTVPATSASGVPNYSFLNSGGRIDLDEGAMIDVSGSKNVASSVTSNIVEVQLRGTELADSPLLRDSALRGATIFVDVTQTGTYDGKTWIGTPLANVSGYANLVQRTVGELTASGGTVKLNAGDAVVVRSGAGIDVSGGWINYAGGTVQTSRVVSDGKIFDIASATPDRVYDGVYGASSTVSSDKWGTSTTYVNPLPLNGTRYQEGFTQGGDGGGLEISAGSMVLDGKLAGATFTGIRQRELPPLASTLSLSFTAERLIGGRPSDFSPAPPKIVFSNTSLETAVPDYSEGVGGLPVDLPADRKAKVVFTPELLGDEGFGSLSIFNPDGDFLVESGVTITTAPKGSFTFAAATVDIQGSIIARGGSISLSAYNQSPGGVVLLTQTANWELPSVDPNRGRIVLGGGSVISTAGYVVDDRIGSSTAQQTPVVLAGGSISLKASSVEMAAGSVADVSGGVQVGPGGKVLYGNGGTLSISTGRDLTLPSVLGGSLSLNGSMMGYSGGKGGTLSLQALGVQIGGSGVPVGGHRLDSSLFSQGGFSAFSLTGVGAATSDFNHPLAGLVIASGATITPVVTSRLVADVAAPGPIQFVDEVKAEGLRSPVSLSFNAATVTSDATLQPLVRGDLIVQSGSTVNAGALGSINLKADTVSVDGRLLATGGKIQINGGGKLLSLEESLLPATTVLLGDHAVVDVSGSLLLVPDAYGRRRSAVLDGGRISVSGNLVAKAGAVLDASGVEGTLDLLPGESGSSFGDLSSGASGTTTTPFGIRATPSLVQSDGGSIVLTGGQMLLSDATLRARSGGATASGGTLQVSSSRFYLPNTFANPFDPTMLVKANGSVIPSTMVPGIGVEMAADSSGILGGARFSASTFTSGGFSNLDLGGTIRFSGAVNLSANGRLTIGNGPALYADAAVNLNASHLVLGTPFQKPMLPADEALFNFVDGSNVQVFLPATYGTGTLTASGTLIDVGYLSLQGIGRADLVANQGDIRGNGVLEIAGDLSLTAGQIYPPTALKFTIAAYDYVNGTGSHRGSVTINPSGSRRLPLSAGGSLSIYASTIQQNGVLRAPFGTIKLGWDGTGTAPVDVFTNQSFAKSLDLVLGAQSVTSVSGIDPITGKGITIPYGVSQDGTTWIDPRGVDITSGGLPQKSIVLSSESVVSEAGSQVDIRGGGDLLAYRWVQGLGGSQDILASEGKFAVIPGYDAAYAPYAPFATSATTGSNLAGNPGYINSTLQVGEQVKLAGGGGLPAGTYTLLPARYALLPGAFLVTPLDGTAVGQVGKPDGSSVVSGVRYNGLEAGVSPSPISTRFEVASAQVVAKRAEYTQLLANSFLARTGGFRLPGDSGQLVLAATQAMALRGNVSSSASTGFRGGMIDISSPVDILISGNGSGAPTGTLVLDPTLLSGFGAESLLIGGVRSADASGTLVTVATGNLTLDNAGKPLSGPEVILVARNNLVLAAGSELKQTGNLGSQAETLVIGNTGTAGSGNVALVRVSSDPAASLLRRGVTLSGSTHLSVGANASIQGSSVILDSTALNSLDSTATVTTQALSLGSGRISLALDPLIAPGSDAGLVLTNSSIASLSTSKALSLTSYSSLDLLGAGTIGGLSVSGRPLIDSLALHSAEIRGLGVGTGEVAFNARNILLDNQGGGASASSSSNNGSLSFHADAIHLGQGALAVLGFTNTLLDASNELTAVASGNFTTSGALTLDTPVAFASKAVTYSITSIGQLTVTGDGSRPGAISSAGLGSSLSLTGGSVNLSSRIVLPSGQVNVRATTGDVSISGSIETGGISRRFKDQIRYTDGGGISLKSDLGNVILTSGGQLDVSAQPGGGDAGLLDIAATHGSVSLLGSLNGKGGSGGKSGSFTLDVGTLASTAALDLQLNNAFFNESRSMRVRGGNVTLDSQAVSRFYTLSADAGSITLTGRIDASGPRGGGVRLVASDSLNLESGSLIDVSAADFDAAGKGGLVSLETRGSNNGTIAIKSGSTIDLGVDSWTSSSASVGKFQGILHLRAPRNAGNSDLSVSAIQGSVVGASHILVEGYRVFDLTDFGGAITSTVQASVLSSGQEFMGAAGATTSNYTAMLDRLSNADQGLRSSIVLTPGAELVNTASSAPAGMSLNTVGSSIVVPNTGGVIAFPNGTPGTATLTSTTAAILTSSNGSTTAIAPNVAFSVPAGSYLTLTVGGTVSYSGTSSGSIAASLQSGGVYTTSSTGSVSTISARGTTVTLNTVSTSSIALTAGTRVTLPSGTPGNNTIRFSVAGQIISPTGVVTNVTANSTRTVTAGSYVTLNSAGTLTFAAGTGGAIPIALASGSFTTSGPTTITPANGALTLGTSTSTGASDWNLSTARFGPNSAAGVLTLRSAGDLVLFNSITDGFVNGTYTSALNTRNELLADNVQSWSYRFVTGADFTSADTRKVKELALLGSDEGSLKLGKNGFAAVASGGSNALTSSLLSASSSTGLFQVIRTGSGDIDIVSGRDVRLLNQFATIYSAGTQVADPTLGGTFEIPRPSITSNNEAGVLGAVQQPTPSAVQYTLAGGNVSLSAGNDIIHLTRNSQGLLIADSERQMPTSWLYRRGAVDTGTGQFGISRFGELASTTWWIDFTNFFEGVGALGGGNVSLHAGRDVNNVDAVSPTNARMPAGTPDATKLVELGGGDVSIQSGRDIDGGVYYVEKGHGSLLAGGSIKTNSTRSPSRTIIRTPSEVLPSSTWLPTTLFVGKSEFDVKAGGDLLLGPVANPFLIPQGYNNTFWYKTWFSTYSPESAVNVSSLGGTVSLRESIAYSPGNSNVTAAPALQVWMTWEQVLTSTSSANSQPWLRLTESDVAAFSTAFSLMPGTLKVTSFSSDINLTGSMSLAPAAKGTLELLASRSINGLNIAGSTTLSNTNYQVWADTRINLSDADPSALPGIANPFAYSNLVGFSTSRSRLTQTGFFVSLDRLFAETGSTDGVLQSKQNLHTQGLLHAGDTSPVRLFANDGDINGLTLYSAKSAQILAGQDIRDASFYLQNLSQNDLSIVSAGRDLVLYDSGTGARVASLSNGNLVATGRGPSAGDIQIAGPGTLEVLAGRNLDLGIGGNNADGTGTGITSIGNAKNPYLQFEGADIIGGAGIGDAWSLEASNADFPAFITRFVKAGDGTTHLSELGLTQSQFDALEPEKQHQVALQVFYLVLRDTGRNHNKPESSGFGNYDLGKLAIATLFPGETWSGDIDTQARDIRTKNGGDISLFAPGGSLTLASTTIGNPLAPPGIVTEAGGNINVFTNLNVDLGISRIFTLKGGDEIIWSSKGNIAAGSSSKTVQSAPPTRVLIDPTSADVKTDLAGLATGGGIGVLASVAGVAPSDVDLIAPVGTIDAGDAGIRVSGNLNISAAVVVNAANISVGGSSAGTPSTSVSAPSLGGLSASASAAGAANTTVADNKKQEEPAGQTVAEIPSLITVEVLGYGGDSDDEDEKRRAQGDAAVSPSP